jgi:hypothetical protein
VRREEGKKKYKYSFVTAALGARYKVQQGKHGKKRNERERDSDRIGFFEPDIEEQLCDQRNGACDEGEQP